MSVLLQLTACLTVDGEDECRVFNLTVSSISSLRVHQHTTSFFIQTVPPKQVCPRGTTPLTRQNSGGSSDVFCPRSISFSQEGDFHTPATDDQTLPETAYNCYTFDQPYQSIG